MTNNFLQQVSDKETAIILELAQTILSNSSISQSDFCEFGCYRGDTSLQLERLIEKSTSKSRLWIYDSFSGLPAKTKEDASVAGDNFRSGELFVTKKEVIERFKKAGLKTPHVKKAFFSQLDSSPESPDLPRHISFAFLDGDLYQSIKTSLALVTPRMVTGGIVIVHDYNNPQLPGVSRAVDEWSKNSLPIRVRETLAIIRF